ncbi:UNVERIFIED_CONTAM: hypothetical protein Sangu_2269800 [Sesamum angustifolium]|uniref:Uncharacterized protein n=1 Tax=Sesamum angustifolium TaxID=2727405 RepID=A0AAW2L5K6_9LAMI
MQMLQFLERTDEFQDSLPTKTIVTQVQTIQMVQLKQGTTDVTSQLERKFCTIKLQTNHTTSIFAADDTRPSAAFFLCSSSPHDERTPSSSIRPCLNSSRALLSLSMHLASPSPTCEADT